MSTTRFPILFITSSRIGDAVLSSGLLMRLADEVPNARFTIVASPLTAPLFADTPELGRLIELEKQPLARHWLSLWWSVRGRRWGLVVDMRGSGLAGFLSARRRAVRRSPAPGLDPVHKVIEAARVLQLEDDVPAPGLFVSAERQAAADALLAGDGPILAMAPAANWVGKTWPVERFAVVAAQLLRPDGPLAGGRLLLLGGLEDRSLTEPVRRVVPRSRLIDLVGKVDLLTAYACLKRVRLFIGNDSGLMHLSAAAGAPTLGLFGPSDDRLYGPWGPNARTLRGGRDFEAFRRIDPQLNQAVCHMFDLPIPWVVNAAEALICETESGAAQSDALIEPEAEAEPDRGSLVHDLDAAVVSDMTFEAVDSPPVAHAPLAEPEADAALPPKPKRKPRARKTPVIALAAEADPSAQTEESSTGEPLV
jgi:ADP-heptose:LPS heptosyltransferase